MHKEDWGWYMGHGNQLDKVLRVCAESFIILVMVQSDCPVLPEGDQLCQTILVALG